MEATADAEEHLVGDPIGMRRVGSARASVKGRCRGEATIQGEDHIREAGVLVGEPEANFPGHVLEGADADGLVVGVHSAGI